MTNLYDSSYFRPWSPRLKEQKHFSVTPELEEIAQSTKTGALDLSQKHYSSKDQKKSSQMKDGFKWEHLGKDQNLKLRTNDLSLNTAMFLPNHLMLQQMQAYYHFASMYPWLQQLQQKRNASGLLQQGNSTLKQTESKFSKKFKNKSLDRTSVGVPQSRGDILNIPSPSFVHHQSPKINLNDSPLVQSNQTSQYPLPTAKDGEPLDLLPKSLYMNKAHGGHLCIFCGKLYSRKYGLKIHLRTHTGYKPLKCKVCQRPFGDPSNLNKHIRLHAEGETPYRCDYCGKVLVRRRDLERHIRSRHPSKLQGAAELDISKSEADDEEHFDCDMVVNEELDVVG